MLRRLAWGFIFAIAPLVAFGQTYGRMEFSLQNAQGQAISGASINVYTQTAGGAGNCGGPAGSQAQLFHTSAGQPMIQPLHTDGFGHNYAYMVAGLCYTVTYNSPSTGLLTYVDQAPQYAGTGGPPGPQGPPGTAGNPAAPSFCMQFANSGATQFQCDSSILATPSTHTITAPNTSSSVNAILFVKSYGALCDGSTDDQTAIQAAFTDALPGSSNPLCTATGCSIQFPAGTCLTSTITWKGQPFFGAGIASTIIQGKPGQDVFATPDGNSWTSPVGGNLVHDLKILVDNSVDASASGTRVLSATITASGSGGTDGTQIVTGTTGVGSLFQAQVTVSGGAITAVLNIYNNGFYTTNPTNIAAEPVTGAGLSGATLNLTMGATGGNNTFPNRISGTLGGTANPISPALDAGPAAFGSYNGIATGCTGTINSGALSTLVLSGCPGLTTRIQSWRVVGAPITIHTVGPAGGDLVTTISAIVNDTTLTLATPATSFGSGLSGTFLSPISPPWYMGNCAFAFPNSNGATPSPNLGNWTFQDIQIFWVNGGQQYNHSCGFFVQAPPYAMHLNRVVIQQLWGGYVEAYPATNPTAHTWTGDTASFKNIDIYLSTIPFVIMGGNFKTFDGIAIYSSGAVQYQSFGGMWLHPGSSASISRYYMECGGFTTHEISRFTSTTGYNIADGTLDACAYLNYIGWNASHSTVDAAITGMKIYPQANENYFTHALLPASRLTDYGLGNFVETNGSQNPVAAPRAFYANTPQAPVGKLDSGWLVSGNSATPFTSGDDLTMTCQDFNFGTQFVSGNTYANYCIGDPNGTEITHGYFQALQSDSRWSGGWNLGPSSQGAGPLGKLLIVGDRIPRAMMNFVVIGRCPNGACTQTYSIRDYTQSNAGIKSASLSFGTGWTVQVIPNVDFSSLSPTVVPGDQITIAGGVPSPWTTGSEFDTALWAFQPINIDAINSVSAGLLSPTGAFKVTNGSPVILLPNLMSWNTGSSSADPTSSTGASWTLPLAGGTYGALYNGSTNFQGGNLFPALQGTITYTVIAPPVWTDTLNGSLTNVATTCVLTTGALSSWNANGYFLVDQEILGYAGGPPSPGTTSFTCTRGNFGTIAQAHSSLAAVSGIPTAQLVTKCNGNDASTGRGTNVPILPAWNPYTQAFEAQACSGYNPQFNIFATTGPTGQTFKIGAITISSLQGVLPTPTTANQVPVSVVLPNGGVAWTFSGLSSITPSTIANIQITTGTTLIAANTCTSNTAATMTGVATTSAIAPPTPTSDTSAVTGWGSSGGLSFTYYVTANTFNWRVCNSTASPITPGGSVTWNVGAN